MRQALLNTFNSNVSEKVSCVFSFQALELRTFVSTTMKMIWLKYNDIRKYDTSDTTEVSS